MSTHSNDEQARGYRVTGRVQGVGFRWWTQRIGRELGLGGHVRNLPDGSVEVHARGPAEAMEAFERALTQGPPAARVDFVQPVDPDSRTPADQFLMEAW
jgi:acylphosphatase